MASGGILAEVEGHQGHSGWAINGFRKCYGGQMVETQTYTLEEA